MSTLKGFTKPFKFFIYIKIYVMDYYVTNTEMAASNVHVLLGSEQESESDDSTEVK